jgi:hypothetical protein
MLARFRQTATGLQCSLVETRRGASAILFLRNRFRKAESSRCRGINRAAYHLQHLRIP